MEKIVVTGRIFDGNILVGLKIYSLNRLIYKYVRKSEFNLLFTNYDVVNCNYKNNKLNYKGIRALDLTRIIRDNQIIISEDLNTKGMLKNHKLAKAISDVSFGEIVRQLNYKSNWYGRLYIKVDRYFPSSQLCNNCNNKNPKVKNLKIRV